jgi:hypothetical protein
MAAAVWKEGVSPHAGAGMLTLRIAGRCQVVKERKSEKELRRMMLAAAREHDECSELEDLFIFGPTPRVCTENPIRVDDVMESPKLAE